MKDKEPERYQQMQEFLHSFMLLAIQNVVTKKVSTINMFPI